jgi:hypothetical protein
MIHRLSLAALVLFLAAGASAQTRSMVDLAGPTLPARDKKCEIQFFDGKAPDSPHEIVGHIRVYVSRDKLASRSETPVDQTKPEFRKRACKIGADAVVLVQQTVSNSGEFQTLYVKGDAIHFTK